MAWGDSEIAEHPPSPPPLPIMDGFTLCVSSLGAESPPGSAHISLRSILSSTHGAHAHCNCFFFRPDFRYHYIQCSISTYVLQDHLYSWRTLPHPPPSDLFCVCPTLFSAFKYLRSTCTATRFQLERLGNNRHDFFFVRSLLLFSFLNKIIVHSAICFLTY